VERKKSTVVYTVTFDPETRLPIEILESVVATTKPAPGKPKAAVEYYIFSTHYRLSGFDAVPRFDVPAAARAAMR